MEFGSANQFLVDPAGSSPIVDAVHWLEGSLLGTVGTIIAILAVAWLGFVMLTGRLPLRRGMNVLLGCFIFFGASTIAAGLRGLSNSSSAPFSSTPPPPAPAAPILTIQPTVPFDPNAGEPMRRAGPPRRPN